MAKARFAIGEWFDTLTKGELDQSLSEYRKTAEEAQRAAARGVKYGRLTPPVTGQATAGVLQMGGDFPNDGPAGTIVASPQPRAGYAWLMRRMSVSGLTTGAAPDIVNLHRATPNATSLPSSTSAGIWQFNGNNFAYTFSFGEMVFLEGETPVLTSVGTFQATGRIALAADFVEFPQELMYKGLA